MSQATITIDIEKFLMYKKRVGLSQYGIAKVTGLSRSFISDIENGRRKPRELSARAIADALGVTVEDISVQD